jgi:hypothetical protein
MTALFHRASKSFQSRHVMNSVNSALEVIRLDKRAKEKKMWTGPFTE